MAHKKLWLGMLVLVLAFGAVLTSCSTIPAAKFIPRNFTIDEVLGQVPGEFTTYARALEEAKKLYPKTQGVVYYTGTGGNNIIPQTVPIGFYAVTFKLVDKPGKML